MRTTNHSGIAANTAMDRVEQATRLLQEALAILDVDSVQEIPPRNTREPDRLLRLPEVQRLTGLCRSAVYEQMQKGTFPRSVKAGRRASSWSENSVQGWIADRLEGRKL
jgi:predicted DNA-binding transcriptional regulator AlpA